MMIKGITEKEEKMIKDILQKYPFEFYYYGSRVKGNFTKSSDLDILVKNDIAESVVEEIELKFNESKIPYIVNISKSSSMDNYFYKLIEPDLVKIF